MAGTLTIATLSVQFIYAAVTAMDLATGNDPSGDVVKFTFSTDLADSPGGGATFYAGSWLTGGGPTTWTARCLVGPGTTVGQLSVGNYFMWLKITDSPEVPIIPSGQFSVI